MFTQEIQKYVSSINDSLKSYCSDIYFELQSRGVKSIVDDDIEDYCRLFVDDDECLRASKMEFEDGQIVLTLENVDMQYRGRRYLMDLQSAGAFIAVLTWLGDIIDGIDRLRLTVKNGNVCIREFQKGDAVRYQDPALNDFDPKERQAQAARIYRVVENRGDIIVLSDGNSDIEAWVELVEPYVSIKFDNPLICDMYTIFTDLEGKKHYRPVAFFWLTGQKYCLTKPDGKNFLPIEEFIDRYNSENINFLEKLWDAIKLENETLTKSQAISRMQSIFDSLGPEKNIQYENLDENTPDGNYIHIF